LVSFTVTNGAYPAAGLTLGADGNLYGTTYGGGSGWAGTVFKVTTNGTLTTLGAFDGFSSGYATAELISGNDGGLYGTTFGNGTGGSPSQGTVFRISTNGVLTVLTSFTMLGGSPKAALALASDGSFYGTTFSGGSGGMGTVFRFGFPPIPPFITAQPTSLSVTNGGEANFNVAVSGPEPYGYQWFTSSSRTAIAQPFMSGPQVLSALVTDGGSGYDSVPQVRFIGNSLSPASGTAVIGNGAVTSINLTSHGFYFQTPTIQIDNPSATGTQPLSDQTNATLTLAATSNANATNYFVVVTNTYGSVTSTIVRLAVFVPPQHFAAQYVGIGLQLRLTGTPNYPYRLQSATNLAPPVVWKTVVTLPADVNGDWQFTDTNLNTTQRFYRAVGQ
jgi:uncharacterized repeat protein (TIGR03803 family)